MSTNANCWVSFWEDNDYKGNTRTFSGAQSIYDLAEYDYTNSSQEMDDSINSLKTGSSTWICLFTQHNFEGSILKVGPNETIPDLNEYKTPTGGDFKNSIVSFVMYDSQPNFWSTNVDTNAGSCWLKLYDGTRYTGERFTLYGAGDVVNALCIEGYGQFNPVSSLYSYPRSLTTGPGTWAELYDDGDYKNMVAQFGPNSLVSDLSNYGSTSIMSLKVFAQAPDSFNQSDQTPNEVTTIQKYQTASSVESLLAGALGCIPEVGSLISGVLDCFWPTGPGTQEIWNDMVSYMNDLIEDLIDQNNLEFLNNTLAGYYTSINDYNNLVPGQDKVTKLISIIDDLEDDSAYFLNLNNPEENLTYLIPFGSIIIVMMAEYAYNYTAISGGQTDPNAAYANSRLNDWISKLSTAATQAKETALAWRLEQITIRQSGSVFTDYYLEDAVTGFSQKYSEQSAAEAEKTRLTDYINAQYNAQLDAYISPANLWDYLKTTNTQPASATNTDTAFPTVSFLTLPTEQTVSFALDSYPSAWGTPTQTDLSSSARITGVTLYSSDANKTGYVKGIQISYSDKSSPVLYGRTGSSSVAVTFDSDESIVAIYGGSGSFIDQLFIRTNKGRDFGVGGTGGFPFSGACPQGVAAVITQVETYSQDYVNQLKFTYQYNAWK
ncbi:MAG: insecticidal delta-endotoxin Cry8Ea1 family protein [Saprospiraceae bacterium]